MPISFYPKTRLKLLAYLFGFKINPRHYSKYSAYADPLQDRNGFMKYKKGHRYRHGQFDSTENAAQGSSHFGHSVCIRSEERRVGKECRSGWSTEHVRKSRADGIVAGEA